MRKSVSLVVLDLDNTLYDWVHYFVCSFYDMIEEVVRITGCDREQLLDDFREVHQRHSDSEHPFALLETKTIRELFPRSTTQEIINVLDPAFHAFNSRRKKELKLHIGAHETLEQLAKNNIVIVAHTESKLYGAVDRLSRLSLTKYFSKIYCRERPITNHPEPNLGEKWLERFPMERVVELSHHQRKPNPGVLLEICNNERIPKEQAAYVGDSMARDILMAKQAKVMAIWAKYGAQHSEDDYARLVRISHWTPEDVEQELKLKKMAQSVKPDFIASNNFSEILTPLSHSTTAN